MEEKDDSSPAPSLTPRPARRESSADLAEGLDQIREILLGHALAELERRLVRLDKTIANRSAELQGDVRTRTDVLEAHVKKELEAIAARVGRESGELGTAVRSARSESHDAIAQLEQRVGRIENRLEESVARIERETREQLLAQSKQFIDELEHVRTQLRSALVRELGLEPEAFEEGNEHAPWPAPH